MRHIKYYCIASLLLTLFLCACSGSGKEGGEASFSKVRESDRITVDEAYELVKDATPSTKEDEDLLNQIEDLKKCSGRFLQQEEGSGNRYTADVEFYLSKGEVFCTVDYTDYMGELSDGKVQKTEQNGYMFESFPKGKYISREQDFTIYFGEEQLYISWAGNIEYTLHRGDGSAENSGERREDIEESGLLDTIKDAMDKALNKLQEKHRGLPNIGVVGLHHSVTCDEDEDSVISVMGTYVMLEVE